VRWRRSGTERRWASGRIYEKGKTMRYYNITQSRIQISERGSKGSWNTRRGWTTVAFCEILCFLAWEVACSTSLTVKSLFRAIRKDWLDDLVNVPRTYSGCTRRAGAAKSQSQNKSRVLCTAERKERNGDSHAPTTCRK
jgi:hypothetical protein